MDFVINAFITAFAVFIFNVIYWRVTERNREFNVIGKSLVDTIKCVEACSIKYWSTKFDSVDDPEKVRLEIDIKSFPLLLQKLIDEYMKKLPSNMDASDLVRVRSFADNLFDIATGGDFESMRTNEDFVRCAKISKMSKRVVAIIETTPFKPFDIQNMFISLFDR